MSDTCSEIYKAHFVHVDDKPTCFFLDLVLLTLRFLLLTPVLEALPVLPLAEEVFLLLVRLRFPV